MKTDLWSQFLEDKIFFKNHSHESNITLSNLFTIFSTKIKKIVKMSVLPSSNGDRRRSCCAGERGRVP